MADAIKLNIDGTDVETQPGTTIIDVATEAGIEIPKLCQHRLLSANGTCRMCLVEVEGARTLLTACTTPVQPGMKVSTRSEQVLRARRSVLEFLLAEHSLDCLVCERSGDCRLQDYAYEYGADGRQIAGKHYERGVEEPGEVEADNPFFVRDMSKCILCGRCVRMCAEVMGYGAVDFASRGAETKVATSFEMPLTESSCVFCGNCVTACPTGALQPKQGARQGRAYEYEKVRTICPYCGVGCSINLHVRDGRIIGSSAVEGPANRGLVCVKGHFGHGWIQDEDRLTRPLVRKDDGELHPTSWDEALDLVAERLRTIKSKHGSDAIGGLASAKCTNEENYLFQRFMRSCVATNNVDHCARLCHASTVAGLATVFGSGAMTNSNWEFESSDVLFITGSNTTETHPVIGAVVERGRRAGAKLIVADPRVTDMAYRADLHLQHHPGSDIALLNAMAHVILAEGLEDKEFIENRTEGFAEVKEKVAEYSPERAAELTGVPAADIIEAARMFARERRGAVLYSMGITQHSKGVDNVKAIANLAMLTGNIGRFATGVNPLRGQNNVQGACDMGCIPSHLPGYQLVSKKELRSKFERAWGSPLRADPGLTMIEMINEAADGGLRALYIMGENPMLADPDITHVKEGLENLDFLVVQDVFLTETAQLADVVLPAASFAEKSGTFTNTERRVQLVRPAVSSPGEAKADWRILCDLAARFGQSWGYEESAEIMSDLSALTPSYGGISYDRLDPVGLQWPCPDADHPGTPILHTETFARGKGLFSPVDHRPPAEVPNGEFPIVLTTGRMLYHFHTGSMTRRAPSLHAHVPTGYVEVNEQDAGHLGIEHGQPVKVISRRGGVVTQAVVTPNIKQGVVFMPFHFAEAAANVLTNTALDPVAKIPELKVCAVRLEPQPWEGARGCCCETSGESDAFEATNEGSD